MIQAKPDLYSVGLFDIIPIKMIKTDANKSEKVLMIPGCN